MFFIFSRLKNEEKIAADFSQSLFDTMFVDMDQSLREMGVGDFLWVSALRIWAKHC